MSGDAHRCSPHHRGVWVNSVLSIDSGSASACTTIVCYCTLVCDNVTFELTWYNYYNYYNFCELVGVLFWKSENKTLVRLSKPFGLALPLRPVVTILLAAFT